MKKLNRLRNIWLLKLETSAENEIQPVTGRALQRYNEIPDKLC